MIISEKLYIDRWDLEGPLDEVIENLKNKREQYRDTHKNLRLDLYVQNLYGDETFMVDLYGDREETPEEVKARERKSALEKRNLEWQEKETLRKLKAKYELQDGQSNALDK